MWDAAKEEFRKKFIVLSLVFLKEEKCKIKASTLKGLKERINYNQSKGREGNDKK